MAVVVFVYVYVVAAVAVVFIAACALLTRSPLITWGTGFNDWCIVIGEIYYYYYYYYHHHHHHHHHRGGVKGRYGLRGYTDADM